MHTRGNFNDGENFFEMKQHRGRNSFVLVSSFAEMSVKARARVVRAPSGAFVSYKCGICE